MNKNQRISQLVLDAAEAFSKRGGGTYLDFAHKAKLSREASRKTIDNLVRAGKLCVIERRRVAGVSKPLHVYVPAETVKQLWLVF